jgi:hypothetical protein|tara:strand:+ start:3709 stop:4473 length:765 start_codon:yes stop_codon:yes gene_type:complete
MATGTTVTRDCGVDDMMEAIEYLGFTEICECILHPSPDHILPSGDRVPDRVDEMHANYNDACCTNTFKERIECAMNDHVQKLFLELKMMMTAQAESVDVAPDILRYRLHRMLKGDPMHIDRFLSGTYGIIFDGISAPESHPFPSWFSDSTKRTGCMFSQDGEFGAFLSSFVEFVATTDEKHALRTACTVPVRAENMWRSLPGNAHRVFFSISVPEKSIRINEWMYPYDERAEIEAFRLRCDFMLSVVNVHTCHR